MARTRRTQSTAETADRLQAEIDRLTVRGKHVRALVDGADARRAARAADEIDVGEVLDHTDGVIRSTVASATGEGEYAVAITPTTKPWDRFDWRWSCTCEDARKAGRHGKGPCKHVIAVAEHWLEEQARPTFRLLRNALQAETETDDDGFNWATGEQTA